MKYWWQAFARDYLNFSKKERNGVIVAIFIGLFCYFILPKLFRPSTQKINKQALLKELAQLKISVDSNATRSYKQRYNDDESFAYDQPKKSFYSNEVKGEMFEFDPNTLNEQGWQRLGVKDKTISTIQHFLQKGYKFKHAEDIKKIYGLKPAKAEQLMPYVRIASQPAIKESVTEKPVYTATFVSKKSTTAIIDINEADTSAFIVLPGIGSKLAARIVNFRNKLGGFVSVAQLGETYGLPDSTFQKLRPQLQCKNPLPQAININTADATQLKAHPYLSWNVANAIVQYRQQHGKYATTKDILKIEIVNQELYNKINLYLVAE